MSAFLLLPAASGGQSLEPARQGGESVPTAQPGPRPAWSVPRLAPRLRTDSPGVVSVASLLLPGTGQLLLGQRRWPLYTALEAVAWLIHLDSGRKGRRLREEYRDLAWLAARATSSETRRDGEWEYYERLEHWTSSGRWDVGPGQSGVQPESDPATFNGSVWVLALDLYLPEGAGEGTAGYAQAVEYYEQRAYPPELLWDWAGKEDSLDRYGDLIDRSDEALRRATVVLGAVVANHLLSAADAFVSARLAAPPPVSVTAGLRPGPAGPAVEWRLEFTP